jgi:hypothetical protein
MGKQRAKELLEKLKANQQAELENAAAIFTVAQVAVNELKAAEQRPDPPTSQPLNLPPSPTVSKAQLQQQFGNYNQCRKAAKVAGISFARTPSWEQLVAAFAQAHILQKVVDQYRESFAMPSLPGVSVQIKL